MRNVLLNPLINSINPQRMPGNHKKSILPRPQVRPEIDDVLYLFRTQFLWRENVYPATVILVYDISIRKGLRGNTPVIAATAADNAQSTGLKNQRYAKTRKYKALYKKHQNARKYCRHLFCIGKSIKRHGNSENINQYKKEKYHSLYTFIIRPEYKDIRMGLYRFLNDFHRYPPIAPWPHTLWLRYSASNRLYFCHFSDRTDYNP